MPDLFPIESTPAPALESARSRLDKAINRLGQMTPRDDFDTVFALEIGIMQLEREVYCLEAAELEAGR